MNVGVPLGMFQSVFRAYFFGGLNDGRYDEDLMGNRLASNTEPAEEAIIRDIQRCAIRVDVPWFDYKFGVLGHGEPDDAIMGCGSGFCVRKGEKRWVVTNFHVACESQYVEVRTSGLEKAYKGVVYEATPAYDLALITVEDEDFWKKVKFPLINDKLPLPGDICYTAGFPVDMSGRTGGSLHLRISKGEVTKICMNPGPDLVRLSPSV